MGFDSGGERCSGWLYRPDRPAEPPVVVMAGGLAGERSFGLPNYAERLAEAGYAVFLFDYRHHGDSGGDPRNLVDPSRQRADWEAAIEGVRSRDGLDGSRLVLWGVDVGGGHVLDVAADDPRVRAVVSQTPVLSGRSFLGTRGYGFLAKSVLAGVRDRLQSLVVGPHTVPVAGDPEEFALVSTPGARRGYLDTVPADSAWVNETPGRSLLNLARFTAGTDLDSVTCPVLLLGGTRDDVVPVDSVAAAADELADATFVSLPVGHFDAYEGSGLEHVVGHGVAFLDAEVDG
ncbi:alpha/beta fold hydrolase [Halogeometricum sp. CBA1124]|nr:alpha/beta fold hydrolase [Halogeometricum sp. CBA1124]MUV56904.1 alpha/beta fold hydrolase [Halogeometricum sp. CBA1124]